jgi:ATP-dependent RNA helicase DDX31/DBP7
MLLSVVFNDYGEMKTSTENFIEFQVPSWVLLSIHAGHFFIVSLSSFRIYRETHDPLWAERGKQYKERVIAWKEQGSSWNFESRSFLLEAEDYYSSGNFKSAEVFYDKALSSASQHKFVHEEALICELAANFYLDQGNKSTALKYFKSALERFQEWGAFAKVRTLQASTEEKFHNEDCFLTTSNLFPRCNNTKSFNSDARKRGQS